MFSAQNMLIYQPGNKVEGELNKTETISEVDLFLESESDVMTTEKVPTSKSSSLS